MSTKTVKINICCKFRENRIKIAAVMNPQSKINNGRYYVTKYEIRKSEKLVSSKCQGDHML